ncbi:hypothetical protein HZA43_01220 [Candidatus Peregrinibacteria bacterium]|nr:hypothetical protein [Candidatus Peregrinibacteria bacterium]
MSDVENLESFNGGGPAREGHEQSFEQFQEEQRKTQQALAQLWKEEGKVKAQDDKLAKIIVRFLNDPANTHLFLLIARVVAQNVPSEFIIAILSLIDEGAQVEIQNFLAAPAEKNEAKLEFSPPPSQALALRSSTNFSALPAEDKVRIDQWIQKLQLVALKMPYRVLDTVAFKPRGAAERQISPAVWQFASIVLRDFLNKRHATIDFALLQDFIQLALVEIIKNTETFLAQQKTLPNKS